ncbi:hypothetical protein UY3_04614 [Chelonia mydas]|uniref:Uncharacterized protein n=1 Tax=Chelonia mydas TaxID=8469 RepID=M7CBU4_CHEMY|nr:hypothetical protein UY3_04614 [Chelonia mydas]
MEGRGPKIPAEVAAGEQREHIFLQRWQTGDSLLGQLFSHQVLVLLHLLRQMYRLCLLFPPSDSSACPNNNHFIVTDVSIKDNVGHTAVQGQSKGLQNAYHKAGEANRHSGAAPTSCRFYKELDAILGGDLTSTVEATVDTSVARELVENGLSQEEEILDKDVEGEGDPEAEDDLEARDACIQELFSTPEEASQSQLSELGKMQTGEEASARKQELKEWWDSEKRDQKENMAHQNKAVERLLNVMERQVDMSRCY